MLFQSNIDFVVLNFLLKNHFDQNTGKIFHVIASTIKYQKSKNDQLNYHTLSNNVLLLEKK